MKFTINFLHVCENAFFSDDNKLSLIKIFNEITLEKSKIETKDGEPEVTPFFAFYAALNFSGAFDKDSTDKISILDPSDKEVGSFLLSSVDRKDVLKDKTNFIINIPNLPLKTAGKYKIVIKDKEDKDISEKKDLVSINIL